jgi:hypothetical protein
MISQRRTAPPATLVLVLVVVTIAASLASGADVTWATVRSPIVGYTARNIVVDETAVMRIVGPLGHVLNERGSISGSYGGSIEARLVAITTSTGTATMTIYMSKGSLKAQATSSGYIVGPTTYFRGSVRIIAGTGSWKGASGTLSFTGKMDRQNLHVVAQLHGDVHV